MKRSPCLPRFSRKVHTSSRGTFPALGRGARPLAASFSGARWRRRLPLCGFLLALWGLAACGEAMEDPHPPAGGPALQPTAAAFRRTGPVRTDPAGNPLEWLLPSGQVISPLAVDGSRLLRIDEALPLGLAVHPRGEYLFVTTAGRSTQVLLVVRISTGEIVERLPADSYFLGLAFRPPLGDEVYVSGGGRNVIDTYGFDHASGTLTPRPERALSLPASAFAGGLAVSAAGDRLFVVSQAGSRLHAFDLTTYRETGSIATDANPYGVALPPEGLEAYVSCERSGTLNVFDVSDPTHLRRIQTLSVEKNPEALLVDRAGSRLYVANADEDSVSVLEIGAEGLHPLATLDLRRSAGQAYGSSPNALGFSPTRRRLYVAQAGLNKIAVIDLTTGRHLADLPTGWYPTAVSLHETDAPGGTVRETLFVANGKGIGTPWEGSMRLNPGALSILPVPADESLEALTRKTAENNAMPGRLFELGSGAWENPLPPRRGGGTPIRYVFLVVRENKTYDRLLGAYEPPQGSAEGDPRFVMEDHDRLLPNLYALADRFAICDNYYSNAEASNQGHEMMTGATVNTYVEKLVYAQGRPIPIQAEIIANPATYPKKDFIFQHAMRNGLSFRDYGEAVGAGKDLLLLDDAYVHQGPMDPPWFNLFSRDVDKMAERIEEWESERFAGPERFPRLIVMLLPNDHTFGDRFLFPTRKSMIADNDEATGIFVEWLTRSPYWMESVAFITEDDPQQGDDHVDQHRTLMLTVSPWVRRGYVSHVKYSEANLFATLEYILGLPPITIFDEVAQPMFDLFAFPEDPEPFDALPRQWPEEINLPGTVGSRLTADMDFSEPDEAEGLPEALRAGDAERKESRRWTNRLRERAARAWCSVRRDRDPTSDSQEVRGQAPGPECILASLVDRARADDREGFEALLDPESTELAARYAERLHHLRSTLLPGDPVGQLLTQFARTRPRPRGVHIEGDAAEVEVAYENGLPARFRFRRTPEGWRFDLTYHLAPSARILGDTSRIKRLYETLRAAGAP